MTYFPTYTDADQCLQQHSECQAEAGMGAVSLGYDGYDGMSEYNASMSDDQLDYLGACRWRTEALRETAIGYLPVFDITNPWRPGSLHAVWVDANDWSVSWHDDCPF